jgi:integrase
LVATARKEAERLRQEIDRGIDPLAKRQAEREAPTVGELADRYLAEHAEALRRDESGELVPKKRTGAADRKMIDRHIRPRLGTRKVKDIRFADIDRLHREISKTAPYVANRVASLLSKMFTLSIRWEMRSDNPAKGIDRNSEPKRKRYLAGDELRRLTEALASHLNPAAANAIRLLLLTGARRGEVLGATWDQFDLTAGRWTKPSSHTKRKEEHEVPLSAPARQLLVEMKAAADRDALKRRRDPSPYVFPACPGASSGHMTEIKKSWAAICKAAQIEGVRVHDLRHTYASVLASAGLSLPVIGALLGHTQMQTTQRYAHLFEDPLWAATEKAAAAIATAGRAAAPMTALRPRRHRGG